MKKGALSIFALLILFSCSKHKNIITPTPPSDSSSNVSHVYVCGHENSKAFYWKDSSLIYLTDGRYPAVATSIFVKDTDVYVAGSEETYNIVATYWKNGIPVRLSNGGTHAQATGIYIDKDNNVYVCGWENETPRYPDIYHRVAKYWKNGKSFVLSDSTISDGEATGIVVDDNQNVYVSWWQGGVGGGRFAYYNINEKSYLLNRSDAFETFPWNITISDNNVYIVGWQYGANYSYAEYWKNGVPVIIDSTNNAWPSYIAVYDNNIYILGKWDRESEKIWSNGNTNDLPTNPTGIFAYKQNIYISGNTTLQASDGGAYNIPVYLIINGDNTKQYNLPYDSDFIDVQTTGIFVK